MSARYVPYLVVNDYLSTIQSGQLIEQLLDSDQGGRERTFAESWAMGVVRSKIGDEYDLEFEFTPTLPYDSKTKYGAGDRCTIDFPEWESGRVYEQDATMVKDGYGYICLNENSDTDFDESKWQSIGNQFDIYHIPLPHSRFSLDVQTSRGAVTNGYYKYGDQVWWNGHVYSALQDTRVITREENLNYQTISDNPRVNVFPNDTMYKGYWKDEGEFFVTNEPPSLPIGDDPPVWVLGDNRDPVMVQALVDLSLFMLHKRISPNNVPQARIDAMRQTNEWLNDVSNGTATTDIEPLQPTQGDNISWGTAQKKVNGY